ncbi:hypothetical protein SKP52_15720 [Sphingopyxis fribergensis]|uniref:Uncharacterized protein n=1 Tax=Sphingopyxis fribergensis TaxID=1515612 RepID=A0A0A7PPZ7_9SPHN|nr:hypothetical protein [Sphingopyxis fribergensis]AJA10022.1 hypothetical protein SKP52_15720 [Sphingopyxis fribergensis]
MSALMEMFTATPQLGEDEKRRALKTLANDTWEERYQLSLEIDELNHEAHAKALRCFRLRGTDCKFDAAVAGGAQVLIAYQAMDLIDRYVRFPIATKGGRASRRSNLRKWRAMTRYCPPAVKEWEAREPKWLAALEAGA